MSWVRMLNLSEIRKSTSGTFRTNGAFIFISVGWEKKTNYSVATLVDEEFIRAVTQFIPPSDRIFFLNNYFGKDERKVNIKPVHALTGEKLDDIIFIILQYLTNLQKNKKNLITIVVDYFNIKIGAEVENNWLMASGEIIALCSTAQTIR